MQKIIDYFSTEKKITKPILEIIKQLSDNPLNNEDDIILAIKNMFNTGKKDLKILLNQNTLKKYINYKKEIIPDSLYQFDFNMQDEIKDVYRNIMSECCHIHNFYQFDFKILNKIIYYYKEKIPLWCITGVLKMNVGILPLEKIGLLEILNNEKMFKEQARVLYKRIKSFMNKNPEYEKLVDEIGITI